MIIGHVAVYRTYANSLILRLARTFQGLADLRYGIPRVDLLGNTMVDWICKLSYFRLDTLPMEKRLFSMG